MKTIDDLLKSDIPEIAVLAAKAVEYKKLLDEKEITETEFRDLIDDLTSLKNIDESMSNLTVLKSIKEAANFIRLIREWAPFV